MSAELLRVTMAKAPNGDNTNPTGSLRFTTGAARSDAMPRTSVNDWRGVEVEIVNESATATEFVFILFTVGVAVTLVNTASANDGSPRADRGEFLGAGQRIRRRVPVPSAMGTTATGEDVFFNRIAGAGTPNISMARVG